MTVRAGRVDVSKAALRCSPTRARGRGYRHHRNVGGGSLRLRGVATVCGLVIAGAVAVAEPALTAAI